MSATADDVRQDLVELEIDGRTLQARRGQMVIEVADAAGIHIPRFCYHKKLSIAANCRMCLVEVAKVPKPLPACATPVTEGMKVFTRSPRAIEAQRGTMEFLLINHPLDCPICDQGGECDLQEISIGYGSDRSEYREPKRVVPDQDIGPLIATEMTRCIHCTRCVRFGEEIAGVRELGATGRGEHTRIGTYIERAVTSELSGNVIDLCPVGALTSKPFRFTARAWELEDRESIAPHDCLGSHLLVKVRRNEVMRVDPREEESINECWLSDRDRFSYQGVNSDQRLERPMIKRDGLWQAVDWSTALEFTAARLRVVIREHGADALGALASPSATLEELYLLQKLVRGLGSPHIDHRLRQQDFAAQAQMPLYPWLGQSIAELEDLNAALLVGSNVRKEQPLAAVRLRKAALKGASVAFINALAHEFNFPVSHNLSGSPTIMERHLAAVAKAALGRTRLQIPADIQGLLKQVTVESAHQDIAKRLAEEEHSTVLLGTQAFMHPAFSSLCVLADLIARATRSRFGFLSEGANSAGAWLAGAVPHRGPSGTAAGEHGLHALDMVLQGRRAYLLLGVEPELDCAAPAAAVEALEAAELVVAITPFRSPVMEHYAEVLLPVGPWTETAGTFVNAEGRWQSFQGVVAPRGEARPAWKVLRVLGNLCDVPGFDYLLVEEVRDELRQTVGEARPEAHVDWPAPPALREADTLVRIAEVPAYAVDGIVRRAAALQQMPDAGAAVAAVNADTARRLELNAGDRVVVRQEDRQVTLPLAVDERVPDHCVLVPAGLAATRSLGLPGAAVELLKI